MTTITTASLTAASLEVFRMFAEDAGNWSGYPWVSQGNIGLTRGQRGNLTDLIKKGLVELGSDDGDTYVSFTAAGVQLAAELGIDLSWTQPADEAEVPVELVAELSAAATAEDRRLGLLAAIDAGAPLDEWTSEELLAAGAIYECADCGRGPLVDAQLSSAGRCTECSAAKLDPVATMLKDAAYDWTTTEARAARYREQLIKRVRAAHEAGWSEYRLAEAVGVQRSTIRAWLGK